MWISRRKQNLLKNPEPTTLLFDRTRKQKHNIGILIESKQNRRQKQRKSNECSAADTGSLKVLQIRQEKVQTSHCYRDQMDDQNDIIGSMD